MTNTESNQINNNNGVDDTPSELADLVTQVNPNTNFNSFTRQQKPVRKTKKKTTANNCSNINS